MSLTKFAKSFKVLSITENISPELKYHLDNGLRMNKNIFRVGSDQFCDMFNQIRQLAAAGLYQPDEDEEYYLSTDIGDFGDFNGEKVALDIPFVDEEELDIADAKDKKVELNKPKRGGSKKFYVYVRDPKTKNIKKVSFGDPGMSLGVGDSKRRKSFSARHQCEKKNDKTTAGYWSCRIGRYPHLTGAKKKYTWW